MLRQSSFNYADQTPENLRDFLFINSTDQEEFALFGVATNYYPINLYQENYDPVFRDMLSSKDFLEPIQLRSFFKVEESTTHGMTDTGVDQIAERTGAVWFNISLIDSILGRTPVIGDVVENMQIHQKFEIFKLSKELHRIGRPVRYKADVRLYQDIAGPSTFTPTVN